MWEMTRDLPFVALEKVSPANSSWHSPRPAFAFSGSPCQQPSYMGSGSAKLNRWFYSPQEDECLAFTYTGRGGNENNFLTKQDCEQTCPGTIRPTSHCLTFCIAVHLGFRGLCPHSKPMLVKGQPQECGVETACPANFVCHINTQQSKSICCPDPGMKNRQSSLKSLQSGLPFSSFLHSSSRPGSMLKLYH